MMSRRELLRGVVTSIGAVSIDGITSSFGGQNQVATGTMHTEYADLTATQAAAAIRRGDISAESYAEALVAQGELWQHINAFITQDATALLESARAADKRRAAGNRLGPLHGVPLVFKDNIDTIALPTTGGTAALRHHRPERNAPVAQALFDAGALLMGKNNLHELAMGITSNNGVFGAVRNPYDPDLIPGGSSGGTGAAIAARIAPAGLGTDTGGSVRIPAALCGIAGLRPSAGRYSQAGMVPISSTSDTAGPMARDVADLALLDGVITGDDSPLQELDLAGLRLGIHREHFWEDLDAECAVVVDALLGNLRESGAVLVDANISGLSRLREAMGRSAAQYEARIELARYLEASGSGVSLEALVAEVGSTDVQAFAKQMLLEPTISQAKYREIMNTHRPRYQVAYAEYFASNRLDAMIFPATPLPARPVGHDATVELNGRRVPTFRTYARNTGPASGAGIPGLAIPAGLTKSGMPVGLEIDGPVMTDRRLLAIGLAIQQIVPLFPAPRI